MSKKTRISNKLSEMFPKKVVTQIKRIEEDYRIKSFNLEDVNENKAFFVAEGDKYIGIGPNGQEAAFEVVSQNNIGATGLSHKIGEQFKMPPGSYLLNIWYYDRYYLTIYRIGQKQLQAI